MAQRTILPILAFAAVASSLSPARAAAADRVADMEWVVGLWEGRNGPDDVQNAFLPIRNGEIVSTFTAIAGGTVTRYEILSFKEEGGRIVRREVAFNPGLEPAEPVPTHFVTIPDATHIRFGETVIERTGADRMAVTVVLHPKDAPARTVTFAYRRVRTFVPTPAQ